ncbi:MAG: hypothetical protein HYZ89_01160 [Candidatus Omnitrophica bacterium]|nr:hypothetical protein [Candidatus Omnitrophota bacterium]
MVRTWSNVKRGLFLSTLLLLPGCVSWPSWESRASSECQIAPPEKLESDREAALKISADLTKFAAAPIKADFENAFKNKVAQTFRAVPDTNAACYMLLKTIACVSARANGTAMANRLVDYLQQTNTCQANVSSSPLQIAPVIRVTSPTFEIYKPQQPQAPGQEKARIRVRVSNDSHLHSARQVHVRFLTDDGLGPSRHRADSDEWNAQMGTPSLYTFDLSPRGNQEVVWQPDIPGNSEALYSSGKAQFTVAIHVSWEDLAHKRHEALDAFKLAYNQELKDFILERQASYNSFFDGAVISYAKRLLSGNN